MPLLPISTFETKRDHMISLLRSFVEIESPTYEKASVDRLAHQITEKASSLGADIEVCTQALVGDHRIFRWGSVERDILLLTHMDTVFPVGTLKEMPIRMEDGKFFGPGALDMKAGIVIALMALEVMQKEGCLPERGITLLCTSDEETGSATSRALIEELAAQHKLVLCLEPALPDGSLKTWRKGIGRFTIEAIGRSAHAGSEPEAGINAILEMSHHIQTVSQLADLSKGTTLNVGKIHGGTRTNVVPQRCLSVVDIRVVDQEEQNRVEDALSSLKPQLEGAQVLTKGSWTRPPMPRTERMIATYSRAKQIGNRLGLTLTEGGTGGGSDANFVAPLGIPVLDGMGVVGSGAHSPRECLELKSLAEKAALLAALIMDW
jgi:glutamate carboxypeptidase